MARGSDARTPLQQWQAWWDAESEAWALANPRPRADSPDRRAWAEKKERDRAARQRANPPPPRTPEEEEALAPLLSLHRRLGG
jgi:hypothetical protein